MALIATTKNVQRLALGEGVPSDLGVTQVGAAKEIVIHHTALSGDKPRAADDRARSAKNAGGVTHGVRGQQDAQGVGAGLRLAHLDLAVSIGQAPVDVLDECKAVEVPLDAGHIALQFAGAVLAPVFAEQGLSGERCRHDAVDRTWRGRGRRIKDGDGIVLDRRAQVGRQEGVIHQANAEDIEPVGGLHLRGADDAVADDEVIEVRLRREAGLFGYVFGLGEEPDVVGYIEAGADLVPLGFRLRDASDGAELGGIVSIAPDVVRPVRTGVADPLAKVGEASRRTIEHVGPARLDGVATAAGQAAHGQAAVLERNVRVVQRAGALVVCQGGLTPARALQGDEAAEQLVVQIAINPGRRRVGVDADQAGGIAEPVDVERANGVQLFVLGERIEVQTVVKEVVTQQTGNALARLAVLIDLAVVGVNLQTFEILAKDKVQHTGNGVGAIDRRSAAGDNFDILDQQTGDGVDVDSQGAAGGTDVAPPVNQGQSPARA